MARKRKSSRRRRRSSSRPLLGMSCVRYKRVKVKRGPQRGKTVRRCASYR